MDFSSIKAIAIPEGAVKKIACGDVVLWQKRVLYTNLVPLSTEADGITIYNGGLGYKDGYRIRSGGAETEQYWTTITGYIPYVKGDKLYIYPPFVGENTANTINFYDGSFANLGQITDVGSYYGFCDSSFKTSLINGVSVLDLSDVTVSGVENVAFVRIGNFINGGGSTGLVSTITSGSEMIVTKNEVIPL